MLTQKLHPSRFTAMSNKMAAIVSYILNQNWTNPKIVEMCTTSDGFVLARHENDCGLNDFVGDKSELENNWQRLLDAAELTPSERKKAESLYRRRIV